MSGRHSGPGPDDVEPVLPDVLATDAASGSEAVEPVAMTRSSITRSLGLSFVNNLVGRFGQLAVGVLLARLLMPEDFGVFAVALVVYSIVVSVSELGVSVALIRRPGDAAELGPTVTTITLGFNLLLVTALWFSAPALASALNAPEATGVLRVLAIAVLVAGVTAVPVAITQRDFRQGTRFAADMVNLVVSVAVVLPAALNDAGPYALAWSRVAGNAASAVVLFWAVKERYRPGFDRRIAAELLRFGIPLSAASVLAFAVLNVDTTVISRVWGPETLGFYVLAFNLSGWPVSAFSMMARSVALPAFARLRGTPEAGTAFVDAVRWLLAASILVSVLLAVLALPAITVIYGERWSPAATPLAFLATLGTVRVLHELAYDYLVAMGRTRDVMLIQVAWFAGLVAILPFAARADGLAGVGAGHLVAAALTVIPAYLFVLRRTGVSLAALARGSLLPFAAAAVAAAATWAAAQPFDHALLQLLAGGVTGVVVFAALAAPVLPEPYYGRTPHARLARALQARHDGPAAGEDPGEPVTRREAHAGAGAGTAHAEPRD